MITVRRAADRGHADFDWLDTHHTFSFADYYDPRHMGFRSLRVINDDRVAGGGGFPTHPHRDMEILTYVLDGAVEHKDSMGNHGVIRPGDVQRMTAGTGVRHSEANGSPTDPLRLLQIWILPEKANLTPGYEQRAFSAADKQGRLRLVASRDAREGSVTIHQDVSIYAGVFAQGEKAEHAVAPGRHVWLHVARGSVRVNGEVYGEGDAVSSSDEKTFTVEGVAGTSGEVLLFDLG